MKRKLTFLIAAAVLLLTMMATTGTMWGQTRSSVTMAYSGSSTTNMTGNNDAALLGLSATDWSVVGGKGGNSNFPGLNKAKDIRLYYHANGSNTITVTALNTSYTISDIQITYTSTDYNNGKVLVGGNEVTGSDGTYDINAKSFVVTNGNTSNVQVRISSIVINYSTGGGSTPSITASNVNLTYDATEGSITYTVNNPVEGGTMSSMPTTGGDWLTVSGPNNGTVPLSCSANPSASERTAIVRLTYTYDAKETVTKDVTVTQAGNPNVFNSISDITEVGTAYSVKGTVVAINNKGFIMGDGTGYVYYYKGSSVTQSVGAMVTISGTTGTYGQIIQFTSSATVSEATTSNYNGAPAATVITEVPDYSTGYHLSTYLEFEGALSKSSSNYFITLGENQIQISYPTTAQGTALTALDGKTVHVKGYFSGNNSSGYFSVMLESAEEVTDPTISINPETANPFTYVHGHGPSAAQTFVVTGANLTSNDIVATITTGADYFEITDNTTYSNTVTINSGATILVRMKANLNLSSNYAGVLTLTNTGAENVVVSLTGSVTGATYAIEQYSTPATAHGTITFAPASPVEEGTEVTLTATPAEGYDFTADSWVFYKEGASDFVVDPSITATDNKITMPAYDIWVDGTFTAKQTYAITCVADPTEGGIIESDPTTAYEGQTVTLSYVPETDYELTSIVITKTSDGSETGITPVASGDNYTFEMPGYAVTATATFVYNPNITYVFSDVNNFYKESTFVNHPTTSSNIAEFYYKNGDRFTASGTSYYFSSSYFLLGKTDALVNLPTFTNYKITQIVLHSSTGHSTSVNVAIVSGDNTVAAGQTWSNKDKDYTYDIPAAYQNSALSVKVTNNYNTQFTSITLVRELKSTDPEISVSTNAINNFSYNEGAGPSKKSFTISGSNLGTTPISVALETGTNFGLALTENAENWNSSVSIDPTDGTVNNVTVYVRMNSGLYEGSYNDNISVTWGNLSESVALSGTVDPASQDVTYTLITNINDLTPGYHYIIASEAFDKDLSIMGQQNTNNRAAVDATVNTGTITLTTTDGHYDFVISGDAGNNYTIYDEKNNGGFLYAASSNDNYLKTRESNSDGNSQWSIAIDNTGAATIVAQGSNTRKYLRYNTNNSCFSCYGENSSIVALAYLYKKTTDTPVYYSTTGITVNNPDTNTDPITVQNNEVLTLTGTVIATDPAKLVIEDGGQLIHSGNVNGTMKKNVTAASSWSSKDAVIDGWYTIASPVAGLSVSCATTGSYDFFKYNEANAKWLNQKVGANNITAFEQGVGYLYANSATTVIDYLGTLVGTNTEITKAMSYACDNTNLKGFNLMGNPFSRNLVAGDMILNDTTVTTYYTIEGGSEFVARKISTNPIKPGQGFILQASGEGQNLVFNPSSKDRSNDDNGYISITAGNSEFTDNAFVQIANGNTLRKMILSNESSVVYVMNNGKDYAAARIDALDGSMPVCFKANQIGTYTITIEPKDLKADYLHLIDNFTGEDIDLLIEPSYSFMASNKDNAQRFTLKFNENGNANNNCNTTFAYQNGSDIIVNGEGELQVFDVMGRLVMNQHVNGVQTVNVKANGVYIFKLNENVQKIVVR